MNNERGPFLDDAPAYGFLALYTAILWGGAVLLKASEEQSANNSTPKIVMSNDTPRSIKGPVTVEFNSRQPFSQGSIHFLSPTK